MQNFFVGMGGDDSDNDIVSKGGGLEAVFISTHTMQKQVCICKHIVAPFNTNCYYLHHFD